MPKGSKKKKGFYHYTWRFFCSLKLTVVVLLVLFAGCFLGMFFDQTLTFEQHQASFKGPFWVLKLFWFFELNDAFHSWWFGFFVLLLALNLIACSIERLPKIWLDIHHPPLILAGESYEVFKHRVCVWTNSFDEAMTIIGKHFPKKLVRNQEGDAVHFYGEKHKYARCGVYFVHIALLLIMFGSIATTNLGIDGIMMIPEGSAARFAQVRGPGGITYFQDIGAYVRCDDFRLRTFVDDSPMAFESDISVIKNSEVKARQTIRVNEPLAYDGFHFYQASYQPISDEQLIHLAIGKHGEERRHYSVKLGDRIEMVDKTVVIPIDVMEDYAGLGATLKLQMIPPKGESTHFMVFRQYPEYDIHVRRGNWDVVFHGFDKNYATGVSVGKVPGLEVVFAGFCVMFIGLYLAFMMSHRRYHARIRKVNDNKYELLIAGSARRHQYAFEQEFEKMKKLILSDYIGHKEPS